MIEAGAAGAAGDAAVRRRHERRRGRREERRGIGLVHDWLTGQRGGEHVLEAIARLAPAAPIYTLFHLPGNGLGRDRGAPDRHQFPAAGAPAAHATTATTCRSFPAAMRTLDTTAHRLLVSSSHCVAKGARRAPGAFHVCYCHTPMRYAWDQRRAYFPAPTGPAGWLRERILDRLQAWDVATAGRVDLYLANSTFVAGRIRRYYGRASEVLPPPVDTVFFRPAQRAARAVRSGGRGPGAIQKSGCGDRRPAGGPESRWWWSATVRSARASELAGGPSTRFAGRVGPDELRRLYSTASCYLQTGIEDFGIATVEALACGTPVLALAEGGVLDIVEDGRHGLLVDDPGVESLAAGIDKIQQMQFNPMDLRSRAEDFSAERFTTRLKGHLRPFWPESEGELS